MRLMRARFANSFASLREFKTTTLKNTAIVTVFGLKLFMFVINTNKHNE